MARPAPKHERRFYAANRAFGRFGIRQFYPELMQAPHWHGHIEANFTSGFVMDYQVDGRAITLPADRLILFWAGVPHQLTRITPLPDATPRLSNIYLPLDAFLMMPQIVPLQLALLGGAVIVLPPELCSLDHVQRWYADYRSNDFERTEIAKAEMNALFRRAALTGFNYLLPPWRDSAEDRALSSVHIRHSVAMVRHALENLDQPLRNADITAVTGLHENYALSIFAKTMRLPLKQFVIRMRLMRARALLVESRMAISTVAERSGFTSISQFYHQFRQAYGLTPDALRKDYLESDDPAAI
jgi:AraC-like DNA-binding protein